MRVGVIIAAVAAIGLAAVVLMKMNEAPPSSSNVQASGQSIKTGNIYVAAQPIPLGTIVTQDMIAIQPWPEHLVLESFIRADGGPDKVVGSLARASFQPQEPIIQSKLANPKDPNFLASELPRGMRVITIPTTETEGVGGFVFPGDHVDVMLTHKVEKEKHDERTPGPDFEEESVTETLLTNVMVLAVDQRANGIERDRDGKLIIPRSVSLMASPTDAQRLRLGQQLGKLTLALRSIADRESSDPLVLTQPEEVTQYRMKRTGGGESGGVLVYRGAPEKDSIYKNNNNRGANQGVIP